MSNAFKDAYTQAADEGASPGRTTNDVHIWQGNLIQDFKDGAWGSGAIMMSAAGSKPQYVGGGAWEAYKRADGQHRLGKPQTFVRQEQLRFQVLTIDGGYWPEGTFWIQTFDGGQIIERAGIAYVFFYNTGLVEHVL